MVEIIIQNSIIVFTIIMTLRCYANYLALPQNMYDSETLNNAQNIFKDDKEGQKLWQREAYFSDIKRVIEFIILILLIILSYVFNELKNYISSIVFLFISLSLIYPFLPRERSSKEYFGYTLKAWGLFIFAVLLSIISSSVYLYLFT